MTTALARRPATPYARRLARERGLALASITGSGPGGRIVAADIEAYVAPTTTGPAAMLAAGAAVSAFAVTVELGTVQRLLADFGEAKISVTLDALFIRAAALALEAVPGARGDGPIAVGWETGADRREIVLADAHLGLLSGIPARLAVEAADTSLSARLSIRRLEQSGIRPVAMPLLPGHALRLIISASGDAAAAECLLCFDAGTVGEDDAAAVLARLRDGLETPLRLLA